MIQRLLLAACFCASLLPFSAFCEADVVDDSENLALLEEQQATYELPVAHDDRDPYENVSHQNPHALAKDEPALAKDDNHISKNNNASLLDKVQGLEQEIQELRGQLEVQAHELKLLQEQALSFYKDLDTRLRSAPVKGIANTPATDLRMDTTPTTPQAPLQTDLPAPTTTSTPIIQPITDEGRSNPADEQVNYLAAYELVKNKQFDNALTAMHAFVTKYPHGGYTANAQYWLGELYMVKKDYPQAIEHFNVVLQTFPSSSKCAPSLLKVGYALAASGKPAEARLKLQEVVQKYPDTSTAKLATNKLNILKNE